ncbi:MAG TPA: large conductance mechanosensitive channel protein MscL [Candidatus Limnocylindria bacterium]|nr:large conductance mechanosensitive channel protein MscL [Candidatus Limnocylindria bacterium]
MKKFWGEFKAFAMKGNVLDLAVAVIIGAAFGRIVTSLVNDIIMPVVTLLTGGVNVSNLFIPLRDTQGVVYTSVEAAKEAGISTLNYGMFLQSVIDFLIIAFSVFLFIRLFMKLKRKEVPAPDPVKPRLCGFCLQPVADAATRCNHCTSQLT